MDRKSPVRRWLAGLVAAALVAALLPSGEARAGLVGTDQVVQALAAQQDRDRVRAFLSREEVRAQMTMLGVDPGEAADRVDGLTDAEIARVAGQIEHLPAGQDAAVAVISAALAVFLVLILTDILGYTDVFSFVDPAEE